MGSCFCKVFFYVLLLQQKECIHLDQTCINILLTEYLEKHFLKQSNIDTIIIIISSSCHSPMTGWGRRVVAQLNICSDIFTYQGWKLEMYLLMRSVSCTSIPGGTYPSSSGQTTDDDSNLKARLAQEHMAVDSITATHVLAIDVCPRCLPSTPWDRQTISCHHCTGCIHRV